MAIERWETELDSGIGRGEALRVAIGSGLLFAALLAAWVLL